MFEGKRLGKEAIESIRKDFEGSREWARVGSLLAHISDLETELENARQERDEARASATREWEVADAFHVQAGSARLKPSGQVAEDERLVRNVLRHDDACPIRGESDECTCSGGDAADALLRLAAKAQGYDAAVADNAALRESARKYRKAVDEWMHARRRDWDTAPFIADVSDAAGVLDDAIDKPHPGAALLEEHRKALVRARNEGLEKAAALADGRKASHLHNRTPCGPCTEDYVLAGLIRAMKEPEK